MIRIRIDWDFISPALQTVSGIVSLHHVVDVSKWTELCQFRVKVEPGSVEYKSLDEKGVPTVYLDAVKPQLDVMVRSYQQGVIMDRMDFSWLIETDWDQAREAFDMIPDRVSKDCGTYTEMKTSEGET